MVGFCIFRLLFVRCGSLSVATEMMEPTNSASFVNISTTAALMASGDEFIKEPLASNIFRLIVYTIIFLLTITGNASVLAVVYKIRELHTGR